MDIDVLKTFMEVSRTRHFARAAENLFVTQAGVSARIAQLESNLGTRLFTRQRNNIQLTSAGHRLVPYAEAITSAWQRALVEVGYETEAALVTLGCLPSVAEIFLDRLLAGMYRLGNEWLLQVEHLSTPTLVARVRDQSLQLGLLYEPPRAKDLNAEVIAEIELVMVSATPGLSAADEIEGYVYVDWGPSFAIAHDVELPRTPRAAIRLDTPGAAYRLLTSKGGTAYLARTVVANDLAENRLYPVAHAPTLTRSVYLICSSAYANDENLESVRQIVRSLARD